MIIQSELIKRINGTICFVYCEINHFMLVKRLITRKLKVEMWEIGIAALTGITKILP